MATILVVEDNAPQRQLLTLWLTRNNHNVVGVVSGNEARTFLEQDPSASDVELIITDVNMADGNGIELIRWLRDERQLQVPAFVLSSRCNQEELDQMLRDGVTRILPKPFSPTRLIAEIEKVLADWATTQT